MHDLGVNMSTYVPNDIRISVSNAFNAGCGTCSPGHFNVNTFQFSDDVDIIRGKHQIAVGVDFIRSQLNSNAGYLQNGNFAFNGSVTNDPMLDFLYGLMSGFSQSRPQQVPMRASFPGVYAHDTIHVNQHLVVNAGLRWEPMIFPTDYFHRGSTFSMTGFLAGQKSTVYTNAPAGSLYYGDPGVPAAFTNDKWTNFSPRLGIVWDPKGDGRQTIRAGGALLYNATMLYLSQRLTSNPPIVNEIDLATSAPGGFSNPWATGYNYPGGNPFPGIYSANLGPSIQWLNASAFKANPLGTYGNLGRDIGRAPGQINFDAALSRNFGLTERLRLDARAEAFKPHQPHELQCAEHNPEFFHVRPHHGSGRPADPAVCNEVIVLRDSEGYLLTS